jgi:transposase
MINGIASKIFYLEKKRDVGVTAKDNRLFVDAVLYRYRAGIPSRDLPERFGDFRVIHVRHSRWNKKGLWQKVFELLSQDRDNEHAMIDSTIVRAHQHSAGDFVQRFMLYSMH